MPPFNQLFSKLFESYTIPLTVRDVMMRQFHGNCGDKIASMSLRTMFSNNETSGQTLSNCRRPNELEIWLVEAFWFLRRKGGEKVMGRHKPYSNTQSLECTLVDGRLK